MQSSYRLSQPISGPQYQNPFFSLGSQCQNPFLGTQCKSPIMSLGTPAASQTRQGEAKWHCRQGMFGPMAQRHWMSLGDQCPQLCEISTINPSTDDSRLANIKRLPVYDAIEHASASREVRTLPVNTTYKKDTTISVAYRCPGAALDLHHTLMNHPKPSTKDRYRLARVITQQVQSLHMRHELVHGALQAGTFVFLDVNGTGAEYKKPYTMGWLSKPSPAHRHPDYDAQGVRWYDDVWSLMMILSEICEWKPLEVKLGKGKRPVQDKLCRWQARRKLLTQTYEWLSGDNWDNVPTHEVFSYGFGFIDKPREVLDSYGPDARGEFFETLCSLLTVGSRMDIDPPQPEFSPPKKRVSFKDPISDIRSIPARIDASSLANASAPNDVSSTVNASPSIDDLSSMDYIL
ncbi:hypothetical protein AK830_g1411 [Neonectria ditissima]|uniref:Protein kinase domain-containing protein n=1 Tax=Neonectria ditissima TaxID=78410 RepID=A0A0P7B668_9HYPO|nr:hypothetical protein AK830_g1411 [Neonectria ditissima]